jgi:hypothetical protein
LYLVRVLPRSQGCQTTYQHNQEHGNDNPDGKESTDEHETNSLVIADVELGTFSEVGATHPIRSSNVCQRKLKTPFGNAPTADQSLEN